jgi:hypothetical protein
MDHILPKHFEDLEPFADWALASEVSRSRKRWSSSMEDITRFYDAMTGRLVAAIEHLDRFDIDALPEPEDRLMSLALSLAEIANAVEIYGQPGVPNAFSPERYVPVEKTIG